MKNNGLKFSRGLWKLLVFAVKSSVNSEHPQGGNWSLTPNIVLKEMSKTYLSQNILFNFMSQKLSFFLVPTFFYQADRKIVACCGRGGTSCLILYIMIKGTVSQDFRHFLLLIKNSNRAPYEKVNNVSA